MIKLWHAPRSRSNRVVWLCEEMGVPYEVVSLKLGEKPPELIAMNPGATVPVMTDGDQAFFESVTMMEYVAETYGPTDLVVGPDEAGHWNYRQMLLFGEATLAAPINFVVATAFSGGEADQDNFTCRAIAEAFRKRIKVVAAAVGEGGYAAAGRFTLADISLVYGVELALKVEALGLKDHIPDEVAAYVEAQRQRPAYQRMIKVR